MMRVIERRTQQAILIFDVEDVYARQQRFRGPHPRPVGPLCPRRGRRLSK